MCKKKKKTPKNLTREIIFDSTKYFDKLFDNDLISNVITNLEWKAFAPLFNSKSILWFLQVTHTCIITVVTKGNKGSEKENKTPDGI